MRWGTATIEAAVRALSLGAWLAFGGLAVLPGAPAGAQQPDAQELIDRIRQVEAEGAAASAPQPELGEDEMRAIVAESLGVEILAVEVVEHAGAPAYAITVMNPGGNRNDAFRVATLLFDGATGALLGQRSPAPRVAAPDPSTRASGDFESRGREIRRRSAR